MVAKERTFSASQFLFLLLNHLETEIVKFGSDQMRAKLPESPAVLQRMLQGNQFLGSLETFLLLILALAHLLSDVVVVVD